MKLLLLLLPLMLPIACTDKLVNKPLSRAVDRIDFADGSGPIVVFTGGLRDRLSATRTVATSLERLDSLADCQGPGTRIVIWSESQSIDGILQKEEQASALVSTLCDSEHAPSASSQSVQGLVDPVPSTLTGISESIHSDSSLCADHGGYRLRMWQDSDLDQTIDLDEIGTLSQHILCHRAVRSIAGKSTRPVPPSLSTTRVDVSIRGVQLDVKGPSALHSGSQNLICSAEVITSRPDLHPETQLLATLYKDGKPLAQKLGGSVIEGRSLIAFEVPAGWAIRGSRVSCDMVFRSASSDSPPLAKGASESRLVSVAPNWERAMPRDILEIRSESHGGRLAFVFTLAEHAPVLPNSCDLHLIQTLSGAEEIVNFELKAGTTRVITSEAVPRAFDIRLDRFRLSCEGDTAPAREARLRWSEGLSEINPSPVGKGASEAYQLSEALLDVPFSFQRISSRYLPQSVLNRLNRDTIAQMNSLRPQSRASFIEYLARTGQTEVLNQLSDLWSWYAEALRLMPCQSPLLNLRLLSHLFGSRMQEMLHQASKVGCRPYELMRQAAFWANETQEFATTSPIEFEFFTYMADFKIRDMRIFLSLAHSALTQDQSRTRSQRATDIMQVFRTQPELLHGPETPLLRDLLSLLVQSSALTPEDLTLWPLLRSQIEIALSRPPTPQAISALYGAWLRDFAHEEEVQASLAELSYAPDVIRNLPHFLSGKPDLMCPFLAEALGQGVLHLSEMASVVTESIEICPKELLAVLGNGKGAQLLTFHSMPEYLKMIITLKGETAQELKAITSLSSPEEVLELLRQGRLGSSQALSEWERLPQAINLQWLRKQSIYAPLWKKLSSEAALRIDAILATADAHYDAALFQLYLSLLQAQDLDGRLSRILSFGLLGAPASLIAAWYQETHLVLPEESRRLLARSLEDESVALETKLSYWPLYKAAGLDLEPLTLTVMTAFQATNNIALLRGLGPGAAWQNLIVDAYAKGRIELSKVLQHFGEEGCAYDTAEDLRARSLKYPRLAPLRAHCLLQQDDLSDDEQTFLGHQLPTLLSALENTADKRHIFLVPALSDAFRARPSQTVLYILRRLAPFSSEAQEALFRLQTEFMLNGEIKRSMDLALTSLF
jgi:hypothetical protein